MFAFAFELNTPELSTVIGSTDSKAWQRAENNPQGSRNIILKI